VNGIQMFFDFTEDVEELSIMEGVSGKIFKIA
jgi:hypothetical protein